MAKIFISYSRVSKDVIEELVQDLTSDDHEIWFDQHLTGGQRWWDNILSEIRRCEIFVAALTPEFLESRACQRELKYALELQRTPLPVRLSDKLSPESLPPDLSELQWVDYSRPDKQALKSLQRTLRYLPKAPPLPDPLPDAPPVPISYLSSLRARIETDSQLQLQDQIELVFELRRQFRNGDPANEIMDLLQRLKRRDDLFVKVAHDIDHLRREIDSGLSGEGLGKPPMRPGPALSRVVNLPVPPAEPAVAEERVALPMLPVLDQPAAPSEYTLTGQLGTRAEPTAVDPLIAPPDLKEPLGLTGNGYAGERANEKRPEREPRPIAATRRLFGVGLVVLAVTGFFYINSTKKVEQSRPQLSSPSNLPSAENQIALAALGMQFSSLTDESRQKFAINYSVASGVVITDVDPDSGAAEKHVKAGDVIVEINQEPVKEPADIAKKIEALKSGGRKSALLLVANGQGEVRFVALGLP